MFSTLDCKKQWTAYKYPVGNGGYDSYGLSVVVDLQSNTFYQRVSKSNMADAWVEAINLNQGTAPPSFSHLGPMDPYDVYPSADPKQLWVVQGFANGSAARVGLTNLDFANPDKGSVQWKWSLSELWFPEAFIDETRGVIILHAGLDMFWEGDEVFVTIDIKTNKISRVRRSFPKGSHFRVEWDGVMGLIVGLVNQGTFYRPSTKLSLFTWDVLHGGQPVYTGDITRQYNAFRMAYGGPISFGYDSVTSLQYLAGISGSYNYTYLAVNPRAGKLVSSCALPEGDMYTQSALVNLGSE
jgi:hypothetical protein